MVKVVITDDQVILRESLKVIIEQDPEIEVVGCAGNGAEAAELCQKTEPDVVLMDMVMPGSDGVSGTRLIKANDPKIKVLILTTYSDDLSIAKALKNGADGYVLKDIKPEALILAIKSIAKGIPVFHQEAYANIVKQIKCPEPDEVSNRVDIQLSARDITIMKMIVDGKNNREIASQLNFTEGSVKNIVSTILEKLKLRDRTQLAVFAVKNRIV